MKTVEDAPNSEPGLADTSKNVLPSSVDIRQNSLRRRAISATAAIFLVGAIAGFFTVRYIKRTAQGQAAPVEIRGSSGDYMRQKNHGTCVSPVGDPLRWDVDVAKADQICCFNRHFAERKGSWTDSTFFDDTNDATSETILFYDSVTEKKLFTAPVGRTRKEFEEESIHHGWPSFRDAEVDMENVRVLEDGEVVSVDGTHLGHNLPDEDGNRYCINLISVAGMPPNR